MSDFILNIEKRILTLIGRISPKLLMRIRSLLLTHRFLNLRNPQNLNDKINWIRFNTDISLWPKLADKFGVRDYIKEKGMEKILVPLYGTWNNPHDIDFDGLPPSFVIKTNNGCGTNIIVKDKSKIDINEIIAKFDKWLKPIKISIAAERHYQKIKPLVIIEKFLEQNADNSTSLIDYKFYCMNGKPQAVLVCYNRKSDGHSNKIIMDLDWNARKEYIMREQDVAYPLPAKPQCLDEMIEICKILSASLLFVRVDLYEVQGKVFFGELTLTPSGSLITSQTKKFVDEMGKKLCLPINK